MKGFIQVKYSSDLRVVRDKQRGSRALRKIRLTILNQN